MRCDGAADRLLSAELLFRGQHPILDWEHLLFSSSTFPEYGPLELFESS